MARSKKSTRRRKNRFTIPLAVVAPLGKVAADSVNVGISSGVGEGLNYFQSLMTGYNIDTKDWKISRLYRGLFPVMGGVLVHKAANRLGLNRALSSAGIPWIRL